jgi:hypothetical protein
VVACDLKQRAAVKKSVKTGKNVTAESEISVLLIHEPIRGGWTNPEMRNFKIFKTRVGLFTRLF